jgi:hypothetical protein
MMNSKNFTGNKENQLLQNKKTIKSSDNSKKLMHIMIVFYNT